MMYETACVPQPAWEEGGDGVESKLFSVFNCSKEQNSPQLLFYSHFSPCSMKVTKISHPVPKKKKMTSLAPLSSYKIFSSAASISASQGLSSLLSAWRRLSQVFHSLGWGAGKQFLPPPPLTEIKLKAFDADGFGKTTPARKLFCCSSQCSRRSGSKLG